MVDAVCNTNNKSISSVQFWKSLIVTIFFLHAGQEYSPSLECLDVNLPNYQYKYMYIHRHSTEVVLILLLSNENHVFLWTKHMLSPITLVHNILVIGKSYFFSIKFQTSMCAYFNSYKEIFGKKSNKSRK